MPGQVTTECVPAELLQLVTDKLAVEKHADRDEEVGGQDKILMKTSSCPGAISVKPFTQRSESARS